MPEPRTLSRSFKFHCEVNCEGYLEKNEPYNGKMMRLPVGGLLRVVGD